MGQTDGFLQFNRELPSRRPIRERVNDFNEFIERYSNEKLNQQAARCMDCGVPFCHNGCPLGNEIPAFNDAVYRQSWKEAYEILSSTNNFPEFTGRICPAPCESACVLSINLPAVTIEEIEKHIIEIAFEKGYVKPRKPVIRSGKKVAVIGSGPAGLAAAAQLNSFGHTVVVYERDDLPGGLLRYGIPDFKLEKWVIDRRIKFLEEEGVIFKCNVHIGKDISIDEVRIEFDTIVLTGGSTVPRDLGLPGRHLKGVHFAMDYLKQQNQRVARLDLMNENILATGKHVVVIGGGDTGSDCVGTANRQRANSVTQFELLPKPPAARTLFMPWPVYPMVLKTTSSHEEGAIRQWAIATKEFIGNSEGQLTALKIATLEWSFDEDGKLQKFIEIPNSEVVIQCDLALLAMGFIHPEHNGVVDYLGLDLDERGNVKADEKKFETSVKGIFAAGDIRRGQSLVVWAIAEGRECARSVDKFLSSL